jgi:hypothetical protein
MNQFRFLLQPERAPWPPDEQADAERRFPDTVARSHLRLWSPGQAIPARGKRLLVGVATYSPSDLRLLGQIDEAVSRGTVPVQVEVFSTRLCPAHEDLDRYIPGIGKVFQTPVVGLWEDGVLRDRAWGKAGRDLIVRTCALEPSRS